MEETVWLYIGVIAALIGIASVISLFNHQKAEQPGVALASAVASFKDLCTQVCPLPVDTRLSVQAQLAAGTVLYSTDEAVCAEWQGKLFCARCPCVLQNATILNLTSDETKGFYDQHEFTCSMTKTNTSVVIGCSG